MKNIKQYISVLGTSFAATATAHAAQLRLPTPPPTGTGEVVTASSIVEIITTGVNYLIGISTVIAVGVFVYGAILYTVSAKPDEGKAKMQNAAWGLLAILGVGLGINTIAGLVQRGFGLG